MSINLQTYQRENMIEVCQRLSMKSELRNQRSDISKEKVRVKINQMIKTYKEVRVLTKTIK